MTLKKQSTGKAVASRAPKSGTFERVREMNTEIRAKTSLKPAGGSLVMTVPAAVRKALGYTQGTELSVSVDDGRMIIEAVEPAKPAPRVRQPKYTLDELLNDATLDTPMTDEERTWQNAPPVGREIW
ncbi:MAG TPA: AbrB/MazE/SpoVT family DNA-binding domain-containing protein [Devosia sp.]|nr:AbrB/MazE/SpoVT family DNA-binding domain-containing protein [Devosia sp.]